jgi:hypothetical protein
VNVVGTTYLPSPRRSKNSGKYLMSFWLPSEKFKFQTSHKFLTQLEDAAIEVVEANNLELRNSFFQEVVLGPLDFIYFLIFTTLPLSHSGSTKTEK